jgi:glycosyltransferase involved in cell wall biosynthesis
MSRKVWIISELYYPEETSTGYLLTRIAEGLTKMFSVYVLCSQPTYSARGKRGHKDEIINNVKIIRCLSTTFNKDIPILRFINLVTITLSILVNSLIRFAAGDCVIVVTNPPTLPISVAIACGFRRAKSVLIVHDVYPEVLVVTKIIKQGKLINRIIEYFAKFIFREMKKIVVLGRDMASLIEEKLKKGDKRIEIIPNWADLELVKPGCRKKNELLGQLGLIDKFVIQYAGNMGRTHGIENITDCAEKLMKDEDLHFLFIGSGSKKKWLEREIITRRLKNITLLGNRPRSDQFNFLNACDVAIISFIPMMSGISVPSRMYNIMAAGKPIIAIADPESELAQVVKEEKIGWVISPGDIEGIRIAILEAKASSSRLVQMGQKARMAAEKKYSFDNVIRAYMNLVQSVFEEGI